MSWDFSRTIHDFLLLQVLHSGIFELIFFGAKVSKIFHCQHCGLNLLSAHIITPPEFLVIIFTLFRVTTLNVIFDFL